MADDFEIADVDFDEVPIKKKLAKVEIDDTIYLDEFDLNAMHPLGVDDIKNGIKAVMVGKPGSGKSKLIEAILTYKEHICPVGQYYAGTEESYDYFDKQCTSVTTFNKVDLEGMTNFVKRQKIAKKYLPNPWAFIVADDVTDDPKQLSNKVFSSYYKNGRKWCMIFILAMQYALDLKPGMRTCIDYSFIFKEAQLANRRKLYENFAPGCVGTFSNWCDIMDAVCNDYICLVVNNRVQSNNIRDCLFWFRVDTNKLHNENYKFGHPTAHAHDKQRKDPNYSEAII